MIQLPKRQVDGTNSGSRVTVGLTFGTLLKTSWLAARGYRLLVAKCTQRMDTARADRWKTHSGCSNAQHDRGAYRKHRSIDGRNSGQIMRQQPVCRGEKRRAHDAAGCYQKNGLPDYQHPSRKAVI